MLFRHKSIALISALALLGTISGSALAASVKYSDVSTKDWFYKPVLQATAMDLFSGYSDGNFHPNDAITRAQAVQVLYNRYKTTSAQNKTTSFSDVSASAWYSDAVSWASSTGIVKGVGNSKFAPDAELTREQLVAILYAQAGSPKTDPNSSLGHYIDYKNVSPWARDGFAWAVDEGIIQGIGGKLTPQGTASRAQMATIMTRYLQSIEGVSLPSLGI